MTTPIYDFLRKYADSDAVRMHMPGHKGVPRIGCEPLDLTEITGADELFAPEGIIAESEANASKLFGCKTIYSTEGSSLCIRAMLYLAAHYAISRGQKPVIAAARNVHKTFLTAAALLDLEVVWLPQAAGENYLSGGFSALPATAEKPTALYLTSPDYLGGMCDIRAAAAFCHENDMLLLVDHAHGAYLHFLPDEQHPCTSGADICCDSAHKTLPVLTGGAYLHIADHAPALCKERCKEAMALFGSTSPSYLILASLDRCNTLPEEGFPEQLYACSQRVMQMRAALSKHGFELFGDEPLKITLLPKSFGYTGYEVLQILENAHIFCEFADPEHLVLMLSPYNSEADCERVLSALCSLPRRAPILTHPPELPIPETVLSPRKTMLSPTERLPLSACKGRICAEFAISCPPAVPIVMCGERITEQALMCMEYYGMQTCSVVK